MIPSFSKRRILVAICVLSITCSITSAGEITKRPITLEDLWKIKRLGKPSISPEGDWVAVDVTSYNMDDNSSTSHLWLCSTDGKTQKQLTTAKGGASGPIWSPDGKSIAFASKRGDSTQIYVISPNGGEARQVSNLPMTPTGLKWSADSKTIYCVVKIWPDTPDDESYKKKEKARKDSKVQAYVIDDALYRVWDHWIADGKRPVVFAVDVASGKHKNLFANTKRTLPASGGSASDYDISPDGDEICFTSESTKELGMDFNTDIYAMPLDKPGDPVNLTTDNPANDSSPVYMHRGIAFLRQTTKYFYADRQRVMFLIRVAGKIERREITKDLDRSCSNPQGVFTGLAGPSGANLVYFEFEDKGYLRIRGIDLHDFGQQDRYNLKAEKSRFSDSGLTTARGGAPAFHLKAYYAFLRTNFDTPDELWAKGRETDRRIDRFNDDLRSRWDLGPTKEVWIKGAENADVQMWIVYPPQFDPKKKYPLIQFVHGGPHNGITTGFHFRWNFHLLASKGYVVSCVNFHGSSGFGQKFTDSITGDMATKPFIDVMKATDYMENEPYIDKNRMTAVGASYGGYMMAWLNGHTDRFKAMVCHAGVYNWHSMMASDFVRGRERPLGAMPWGDQAKIDKQNPQRFAANFKTPTLVMHGEKDYRVPVTQGFEYYNTLRIKGVPTRLVYFPDENHWILRPQNSRLWYREFFAWLDKHVGSGPTK